MWLRLRKQGFCKNSHRSNKIWSMSSKVQRNLLLLSGETYIWSYKVKHRGVELIWENSKTCLSVYKKDNKVSRMASVGQNINKNKTQQKPTEQSLFVLSLIGFSFSFQSMNDLAVGIVWKDWHSYVTKGCDLLESFHSFRSSETGALSKGNGREMGLWRFNDEENNKENMF